VSWVVRAGGDAGLLACSHDGSLLAYIPDQGTDDIIELYMVNPDGTNNTKLSGMVVAGGRGTTEFSMADSSGVFERGLFWMKILK